MGNQDRSIGERFMQRTFDYSLEGLLAEGHGEEGDPGEPLKFKIYRNTPHYEISQTPSLFIGDARWSFQRFRQEHDQAPLLRELTLERLSTLLYYTYGFSRYDKGPEVSWPFHRLVASARCFFPTELSLWIPHTAQIPAGIYHYDALHQRLALLRQGDFRTEFSQITDANLDGCLGILLISSLFWKTAFRYRNFAYRLCTQEAGLVIGNALMVAGTLGLRGHVHYQFLDQPANKLLGFEQDEESLMAILPLYPWHERHNQHVERLSVTRDHDSVSSSITPIEPTYIKYGKLDQKLCASLLELDKHSFLTKAEEIVTLSASEDRACSTSEDRFPPPPPLAGSLELAQALYTRSSGDEFFVPLSLPLSQQTFWEIISYVYAPYVSDLAHFALLSQLQIYLVMNHVEGSRPGVYRLCASCGMLHAVQYCDASLQMQMSYTQSAVNCASANMVCYIAANYNAVSKHVGNRSYRILHMESSIIAQRLCLMSAAYGLTARCTDSYYMPGCQSLLKLADSSILPIFQIVIGYERPGANAGARYRLSLMR